MEFLWSLLPEKDDSRWFLADIILNLLLFKVSNYLQFGFARGGEWYYGAQMLSAGMLCQMPAGTSGTPDATE
ncbi:hypothetical protein P8H26_05785 [Pseudochrobactrum sp. sp1633]|uniref:hypothetical protein n=1 Tax=Pseudochrobactrum sp. sp1633 TaxID=3036706 RepID=UPI0025A5ED3A|nr:hypothetical protein [Pseudochrobactrum sp. sp1633]MDM8344898.1 hypothetical protein [Pseudochrobactrum sp. sp1633]